VGLSVIIINFNSVNLTLDCLQTIFVGNSSTEFEVIVVDNFSQENCEHIVTTRFPQVKWIQMTYNAGFSRANNAGIRVAKGDIILMLNPDTLNENNAVVKCFERFANSLYSGCGVQLLNSDRSPQISGNYFITGGLNQLMALPYTGRFIRWLGYRFKVKKTNVPEAKGTVEVDWINGAFLMVKREAIEKAGLMDEDFFLYSEEIEWCNRLGKTGKMCIYGDLNVVHLQGSSTNIAFGSAGQGYYNLFDRKGLQLMLSNLVRIRKQYGVGWFLFHLLAYFFTIPFFLIIILLRILFFQPGIGQEWKMWKGFTGNVFNLFKYIFLIIRNRPYFYKVL
jgi:GT2 family glycosyltransferase